LRMLSRLSLRVGKGVVGRNVETVKVAERLGLGSENALVCGDSS